jgi:hypothetical protein
MRARRDPRFGTPVRWRVRGKDRAAVPCAVCNAPDGRDAAHARGCPTLAPLTKDQLLRLAALVEEGWLAGEDARAERDERAAWRRGRRG